VALLAGAAPAGAVTVAVGRSPAGERWTVGAHHPRAGGVDFHTLVSGQPESGGTTTVPSLRGGRCRTALDSAAYDSGWQQVAGPVDVSVVWVDLRLRDGRHVGAAPQPLRTRRSHRWLRGFRWMSAFLPRGSEAVAASGYDSRGRLVTRARSDQGIFLCG
jgi:hypothetical protein